MKSLSNKGREGEKGKQDIVREKEKKRDRHRERERDNVIKTDQARKNANKTEK